MTISSFDFEEFKIYKGLEGVSAQGIECLECTFPELRHFNLPKPRSLTKQNDEILPLMPNDPTMAPSAAQSVVVSTEPSIISSAEPTIIASAEPTSTSSAEPTIISSYEPSVSVSSAPSIILSGAPSTEPTIELTIGGRTETDDSEETDDTEQSDDDAGTDDTELADDDVDTDDTEQADDNVSTDDTEQAEDDGKSDDSEHTDETDDIETMNDDEPTNKGCTSDENGLFVITEQDGAVDNIVNYKYQMVFNEDDADISSEILPFLEKKLLDFILPNLFTDECNDSRRLLNENSANQRRKLSIVGASSKPVDVVSSDEVCSSEEGDCVIIDGKMTIMSDSENFNSTAVEDMICTVLGGESLKYHYHPAVSGLVCVGAEGEIVVDESNDGVGEATPTFKPVAQQIGAYSYLVSAAAAIVIILGIYGYRRRHHTKEDKVEVGPLDDSDLVNMSNSLSFEGTGPYNGTPAMDFTPITTNTTYTAKGGIEEMARQSYFPNIEKSKDESDEELAEVSLDELNMTVDGSHSDSLLQG